jgi:ribonuclease HII
MDNTFDKMYYDKGEFVGGIDESGVSDIAGPLVAACVILPRIITDNDDLRIFEVNDSKKIPEKYRKKHAQVIWESSIAIGIGEVSPTEIDYIGKRKATILAMMRAIATCQTQKRKPTLPDFLMVDGDIPLPTSINQVNIREGDTKSLCIAAASIIAKVYRDDIMLNLHEKFPAYSWNKNKGYPCEPQFKGLDNLGIQVGIHRTKFWPFYPNTEKKEDEPYWHWRRGLWRNKTLENLMMEVGTEEWIIKQPYSKESQKSKLPLTTAKSTPTGNS